MTTVKEGSEIKITVVTFGVAVQSIRSARVIWFGDLILFVDVHCKPIKSFKWHFYKHVEALLVWHLSRDFGARSVQFAKKGS